MKVIKAIQAIDWQDVAERAVWTWLQVFIAAFLVAGEDIINLIFNADWSSLWVLVVATSLAGVAAGLSAVKTLLVEVVRAVRDGESR